jgi:hypothetical protein
MSRPKLPPQASWNLLPKGQIPTRIELLVGQEVVAQIKPFGRVWLAKANPCFSRGLDDACVVTSLSKGQTWLTHWLADSNLTTEIARRP